MLTASLALVSGCGGDGETEEDDGTVNAGWITITSPVSAPTYSTATPSVWLAGEAFVSPTWWRCCSGSATDTGVTVTWVNATTGASGSAYQWVTYVCPPLGPCYLGTHSWSATVDLAFGDNRITVTATDPAGNAGQATITVVRTADVIAPTVTASTPANGATNVATDTRLQIAFSEAMDAATLNAASIVLTDDSGTVVGGSVSYADNVALYAPSAPLAASTTYTAVVTTAVRDVAGNTLAQPYVWTFTTGLAPDATPPTITSTSPDAGSTCVATETSLSAAFSEPINAQTLNTGSFVLKDATNTIVAGTTALEWTGKAYFHPAVPLSDATTYTAMLTSAITDLAGNALASDHVWSFTTQPVGTGDWSTTSIAAAPSPRAGHTAVWTGTRMLVWGGGYGDGAAYDPASDSWTPLSTVAAPEARSGHVTVWTGRRMLIWGGVRAGAFLNSGGAYDPVTDRWTPMSTVGAPSPRSGATAVWTGTEMIVWGGTGTGVVALADGARYDPATDTWMPLPLSGAPSARYGHAAVWTGSAMIVWGGGSGSVSNTGGLYTPSSNSWTPTAQVGAPSARSSHTAVWTGREMIVWGGRDSAAEPLAAGAIYDPGTASWRPLSTACEPLPRYGHVAVWSGTELLVWGGGRANGPLYAVGGRYDPRTDTWRATPVVGSPSLRLGATGVWDGTRMIVWGGLDVFVTPLGTGAGNRPQ